MRFVQKMLGSTAGDGIKRNIADCYEYIVNHYEVGDRIFLFGFSRGAYTVRSLANLLTLCGVPTKTPGGPLMRYRKAVKDSRLHKRVGCGRRLQARRARKLGAH